MAKGQESAKTIEAYQATQGCEEYRLVHCGMYVSTTRNIARVRVYFHATFATRPHVYYLPNTRLKGGLYEFRSVGKKKLPSLCQKFENIRNDSFGGVMGLFGIGRK